MLQPCEHLLLDLALRRELTLLDEALVHGSTLVRQFWQTTWAELDDGWAEWNSILLGKSSSAAVQVAESERAT